MQDIHNLSNIRAEKAQKLKELGIDPWPTSYPKITASTQDIKTENSIETISKEYTISGRLMLIRSHGKSAFATLQDNLGKLQIYLKNDILGEKSFNLFNDYIDMGDIIVCTGTPFTTKTGELTLQVKNWELVSKCLLDLPEKFHGISDIEVKYRQRYLDLITSHETKERFQKRAHVVQTIREFLNNHGYLEVETPMLHGIAGGAMAKPFITKYNALHADFYLRIAPELYLKRLVVGGIDRVYEINKNFRNEGVSTRHNPEFTMLEFYTAYKDYHYAMNFVEELLRLCAKTAANTVKVPFGNHEIDFEKFEKISVKDAVIKYGEIAASDLEDNKIDATLAKYKIKADANIVTSEKVYKLFEELVESKLIQPTFVTDFPIEISPLAKRSEQNPEIAARFELYIAGMEISNSYNELNNPYEQADRFNDQLKAHEAGNDEAHQFDADYIKALEYGLPPTVGVGIGIDRLVMILTDTLAIKEVILFPTLKPKHD